MRSKYQNTDGVEDTQKAIYKRKKRDMSDTERVSNLQEKLYQKAKLEPDYTFYVLYDKMFIGYMLREAWIKVKSKNSSAGLDGQRVSDVEAYGVDKYLQELGEELRTQLYQPQAVKRVMLDKPNGGQRPIGIPTIKDRIVQTVCKMILEPIFEADFTEDSYGFRPQRSAGGAVSAIKENLKQGNASVYDADLSKYFDTIPHNKLMIVLKQRISDPRMLKLIMKWLKVPVSIDGKLKGGKKNKRGTPQGGVISPLLANIYMNLIDTIVSDTTSLFGQNGIKIIRYADDFVLMGKSISQEVIDKLQLLLNKMELTLNKEKTQHINAEESSFRFLGFTFRYDKDIYGRNGKYWNVVPNSASEKKLRGKIKVYLHKHGHCNVETVTKELNSMVRGWLNYYDLKGISYSSMSKRRLRYYLSNSLYRYYKRKSQRRCKLYGQNAFETLVGKYELIDPSKYVHKLIYQ